jgi:hypothetical protein
MKFIIIIVVCCFQLLTNTLFAQIQSSDEFAKEQVKEAKKRIPNLFGLGVGLHSGVLTPSLSYGFGDRNDGNFLFLINVHVDYRFFADPYILADPTDGIEYKTLTQDFTAQLKNKKPDSIQNIRTGGTIELGKKLFKGINIWATGGLGYGVLEPVSFYHVAGEELTFIHTKDKKYGVETSVGLIGVVGHMLWGKLYLSSLNLGNPIYGLSVGLKL